MTKSVGWSQTTDVKTVIDAKSLQRVRLTEIWRARGLLYLLAKRDFAVRYRQTILGVLWAVIRPLVTTAIVAFVFSRIASVSESGRKYDFAVLTGVITWQFFAGCVSASSESLIGNASMLQKVYFPRIILPLASATTALVDLVIGLALALCLLVFSPEQVSFRLMLVPLFFGIAFVGSIGLGLLLGAISVRFRDVRHALPFVIQVGLYLSPVGFQSSMVPPDKLPFFYLNPAAAAIDGVRWCFSASDPLTTPWWGFALSIASALLLLVIGKRTFLRLEETFADKI